MAPWEGIGCEITVRLGFAWGRIDKLRAILDPLDFDDSRVLSCFVGTGKTRDVECERVANALNNVGGLVAEGERFLLIFADCRTINWEMNSGHPFWVVQFGNWSEFIRFGCWKLITTSGDRVVGGVDVSKIVFESDGVGDIRFSWTLDSMVVKGGGNSLAA